MNDTARIVDNFAMRKSDEQARFIFRFLPWGDVINMILKL